MKISRMARVRNFWRKDEGAVAVIFAVTAVPILLFIGAAVDYQQDLDAHDKLQNGSDAAALAIASTLGRDYLNGTTLPTVAALATQANDVVAAQTNGAGSVSTSTSAPGVNICAYGGSTCPVKNAAGVVIETLQPGQVQVTATGSQARIFGGIDGSSSVNFSTTSMAQTTPPSMSPATVSYQFQYAKGWDYKIVTLYGVAQGSTTPFALATWAYQPQNTGSTTPNSSLNLKYWPTGTSGSGYGTVTTTYASTTSETNGVINLANSKDSSGHSFANYTNLYLTMQVSSTECAPTYIPSTSASFKLNTLSSTAYAAMQAMYTGITSSSTGNVTCSSSGSGTKTPAFDLTMSTNSTTNSNYIYTNGVEEPSNIITNVGAAFPCSPTSGTSLTTYYEWENSTPVATDTRDYFFALTTTCTKGNLVGDPINTKLVN